ncbi:MAG: tRNA-guanine transglycosylase DpdA [Candidatus Lokiarchaeota archaeon]
MKEILRLPDSIKIFGDCGAFQYRNLDKPPYTSKEVLNYYEKWGFDMGCSIDHIITNKKDPNTRIKRYNITKQFAKECLDIYNSANYSFKLFGVAQGWSIKSYAESIDYLYDIGYKNLCVGGLVGLNKKKITDPNDLTLKNLIKKMAPKFNKFEKVHIFGRGNLELIPLYIKSGVTQFDNNIMRKAWTDIKKSYHFFDSYSEKMRYYTSIRIRLINNRLGLHREEEFIFDELKRFNDGKLTSEEFINSLKSYKDKYYKIKLENYKSKARKSSNKANKKFYQSKLLKYQNRDLDLNEDLLRKLLNDKPWNKCECDICQKTGLHICVFRRRMRNTRRAFHNVFNYYQALKNIRSKDFEEISIKTLNSFLTK